jgi:hypothetical protein
VTVTGNVTITETRTAKTKRASSKKTKTVE